MILRIEFFFSPKTNRRNSLKYQYMHRLNHTYREDASGLAQLPSRLSCNPVGISKPCTSPRLNHKMVLPCILRLVQAQNLTLEFKLSINERMNK